MKDEQDAYLIESPVESRVASARCGVAWTERWRLLERLSWTHQQEAAGGAAEPPGPDGLPDRRIKSKPSLDKSVNYARVIVSVADLQ
jgi:hypothetical protein